jgi:hypothetical protein
MQRQKAQQLSVAAFAAFVQNYFPQAYACGYMLPLHSQLEQTYLQTFAP